MKFVLPSYAKPASIFQESDLQTNYSRLSSFIRCVLKLPTNTDEIAGQLTVSEDGIKIYRTLVAVVVKALEVNRVDLFIPLIEDVDPYNKSGDPKSATEISLGLYQSQHLDMLLGPSNDADGLRIDPLWQCLRLIAIFHEINENWETLFCALTSEQLIDRNCFICDRMDLTLAYKEVYNKTPMKLRNYYYLLPYYDRRMLLQQFIVKTNETLGVNKKIKINISGKNILNVVKVLNLQEIKDKLWRVHFTDESEIELDRLSEFYKKFIGECSRYDLDLWIGGAAEKSDDVGLFPKPRLSLSKESASLLKDMGLILVKSFVDKCKTFVHFSKSLY